MGLPLSTRQRPCVCHPLSSLLGLPIWRIWGLIGIGQIKKEYLDFKTQRRQHEEK